MWNVRCVCLGNICRSPMAEAVLRDRFQTAGLADRVAVSSAGTGGWHIGSDADGRAQAALIAGGYTLRHSARQLPLRWLTTSDLILAMDRSNLADLVAMARRAGAGTEQIRLLRSFDPSAPPDAEVPDPYYGSAGDFTAVLRMIERAADGVVAHVEPLLQP